MATMLALSVFALVLGADLVASNDCCVADQFNVGFGKFQPAKWLCSLKFLYNVKCLHTKFT